MSDKYEGKAYPVGNCHHGYRAYAIVGANPSARDWLAGRWHSGPELERKRTGDWASAGDVRLARCREGDPIAPLHQGA